MRPEVFLIIGKRLTVGKSKVQKAIRAERMKIELEEKDIKAITGAILDELRPVLTRLCGGDNHDDSIMDVSGVATYFNLSRPEVLKMVRERKLPCFKIGNKIRMFRKGDVDRWMDSFKYEPLQSLSPAEKKKMKRSIRPLD